MDTWEERSLHAAFDAAVERYGERPAVMADERSYTYAEVQAESNRMARGLLALGVRQGDRVGLVLANYAEFLSIKLAVSRVGAVAVALNYFYRAEELRYALEQAEISVLITMRSFMNVDHVNILNTIAPRWRTGDASELPALRHVILHRDPDADRGERGLDDLVRLGEGNGRDEFPHVRGQDLGDIMYTSGTTGLPKGVMATHDSLLRSSYAGALTRAFEDGRRILFALPLYHMFAYVEGALASWWVGGAIVPQLTFSPRDYLVGIERHRATEILAVPTMTVALLEYPEVHSFDLSSLLAILSAAAPAPGWVWDRARTVLGLREITTGYGLTETGAAVTMSGPEDPLEKVSSRVGRRKLGGAAGFDGHAIAQIKTVDPVTGHDLLDGEAGEILVHGPTVMRGYWNKPDETSDVLTSDGWLRTGDIGRFDADGFLELTGRSKELYKSGGELVMPVEVETVISGYPGVSQVFVVGLPDERWGEIGCAVVVAEPSADLTAEEIIDHCRQYLARFKVPKQVVFVTAESLPRTPTGKIQKFRLAQRLADPSQQIAAMTTHTSTQ